MKHIFLSKSSIFFYLLAFISCHSIAQSSLKKEDVLNTLNQFDRAMINRNSEVLSFLTSEKLSYGHSSGNVQDKNQFLDDALNGPFEFISIENEDQSVTISKNTGIVRHILTADARNNGNQAKVRIGVIMVFQKNDAGKILLLARQAYKL